MVLYLPQRLLMESRPRGTTYGHHVSRSMLELGAKPELSELVQLLSPLRREDVIRQIIHLLQLLDVNRERLMAIQMELAQAYLTTVRFTQLQEYARRQQYWAIFHRQALWFLLQFAVIACVDSEDEVDESELRNAMSEGLLLANEFLEDGEFPESAAESEEAIDDAVTAVILPIMEIGSEHLNLLELSRFQKLWLEIPTGERFKERMRSHSLTTDWHAVFERKYGIGLKDFSTICTICVSFFLDADTPPKPKRLELDSYFGNGSMRKLAESVFSHLAQTPNELALDLINRPRQSWSRDFSPLRKKPLIWIGEGKLACPQQSFLLERLRDGVYWYLFDAYGVDGGKFQTSFGSAFVIYVEELLNSFTYGGSVLARDRYAEPMFQGTTDEVCDFYLDWDTTVVLLECKASLLTSYQKYSGHQEGLLKGIDDQIGSKKKGVGQLAKSISRIIDGDVAFSDGVKLSPSPDTKFLPVLITYEPLFGFHANRRRMQRKFKSFLSPQAALSDRIMPIVILTLDDLELLQGLSCADNARTILLKYAEYLEDNTQNRLGTFQGFIWDRYPEGRIATDNAFREDAARLMARVTQDVRTLANEPNVEVPESSNG